MPRTILLASYPMSGSAWLDLLIGAADIRIDDPDTHFTEARCAYAPKFDQRQPHGIVVIVRDPRDVALSLAEHNGCSIDDAVAFMDTAGIFRAAADQQPPETLMRWSDHVASWLEQKKILAHLVRYEDLIADPLTSLRRVLRFAELQAEDDAIRRSVAHPDFREARAQTSDKNPAVAQSSGKLLHRVGGWRSQLTVAQITRIENDHGAVMLRLGYALSIRAAGNAKK